MDDCFFPFIPIGDRSQGAIPSCSDISCTHHQASGFLTRQVGGGARPRLPRRWVQLSCYRAWYPRVSREIRLRTKATSGGPSIVRRPVELSLLLLPALSAHAGLSDLSIPPIHQHRQGWRRRRPRHIQILPLARRCLAILTCDCRLLAVHAKCCRARR